MFFEGKKILVTGGTGFVGSHFVEELIGRGALVRVPIHQRPLREISGTVETVNADLTRLEDCLAACQGIDYVIHAAGTVSAAAATVNNAMGPIAGNVVLTALMLQAASAAGVRRFLLYSSSTGYPDVKHPMREEEFWSGPTHPVYFGYGWMRRYLERMGELVHQKTDTKVAIVRPTAVYGRHDDFDPQTAHVIPALIRRTLDGEDPFVVWGEADVVRDFLHVTDLIKGSLLVLEKYAEGQGINIGYGQTVTIGQVVDKILKAAGREGTKVAYDHTKPTTIPFRMVSIEKAQKLLGFEPQMSLGHGIDDTVSWYKSQRRHS